MAKKLNRFLIQKIVFAEDISHALKSESKAKIVDIMAVGSSKDKLEPLIGFSYPHEYVPEHE